MLEALLTAGTPLAAHLRMELAQRAATAEVPYPIELGIFRGI